MTTVRAPNGRGPQFLEPAEPPIATPLMLPYFSLHGFDSHEEVTTGSFLATYNNTDLNFASSQQTDN